MTSRDLAEQREGQVPKRRRNGIMVGRRKPNKGSMNVCFLVGMNIAALCSSLFTIYSCNFFSYKEAGVFNNSYASNADITYEPFEYLPTAGVGLFSYFMGDPTGKAIMANNQMCFYYCDDFTEYKWLSSNNDGTGIVDKWVLARICSIMAPIFGFLALLQVMIEKILKYKISSCGDGVYIKTQVLLIAAFFQIGTFIVILAPPIMSSSSEEDQKQQFCFSETSNVQCKMDAGSYFSLSSTIIYMVLAQAYFFTQCYPEAEADISNTKESIDENDGGERDTDESDESSISDLSESQYSRSHEIPTPTRLLDPKEDDEEDEASVFSTLIQYFGRNHENRDGEGARDTESDANSLVENSIQQKSIDYSRRHSLIDMKEETE